MRLSEVLVKQGIISDAQMELAMADREINDLPLEEVLLARGWIREDVLYNAAPWLRGSVAPKSGGKTGKTGAHPKPTAQSAPPPPADKPAPTKAETKAPAAGGNESPLKSDYNENLRVYKQLLKEITGKELAN